MAISLAGPGGERLPLRVVLPVCRVGRISQRVRLQQGSVQLRPLVHAARERAEAGGNPACAAVHAQVGGLGFDLVDHRLQLLPHVAPLPDGARDLVGHSGHLLDHLQPLALVHQRLERVVLARLASAENVCCTPGIMTRSIVPSSQ